MYCAAAVGTTTVNGGGAATPAASPLAERNGNAAAASLVAVQDVAANLVAEVDALASRAIKAFCIAIQSAVVHPNNLHLSKGFVDVQISTGPVAIDIEIFTSFTEATQGSGSDKPFQQRVDIITKRALQLLIKNRSITGEGPLAVIKGLNKKGEEAHLGVGKLGSLLFEKFVIEVMRHPTEGAFRGTSLEGQVYAL